MVRLLKKKKPLAGVVEDKILINKFINYLIRNGKKSKSKKLLANCCVYTDKLLKKKFLISKHEAAFREASGGSSRPFPPQQGPRTPLWGGSRAGAKQPLRVPAATVDLKGSTERAVLDVKRRGSYSRSNVEPVFVTEGPFTPAPSPHPTGRPPGSVSFHYREGAFGYRKTNSDRAVYGEGRVRKQGSSSKKYPPSSSLWNSNTRPQRSHTPFGATRGAPFPPHLCGGKGKRAGELLFDSVAAKRVAEEVTISPVERNFQKYIKRKLTPFRFFQKAISRVRPLLSLRKLRKGGRTRYIPKALSAKKGMFLAIKWVINSSSLRSHGGGHTLDPKGPTKGAKEARLPILRLPQRSRVSQTLANELWDCFLEQGYSWQKKEELHKLGAANKAFIRYNWW